MDVLYVSDGLLENIANGEEIQLPEDIKGDEVIRFIAKELLKTRESLRWIPTNEKLPEVQYGKASKPVEILYRYKEIQQSGYYRKFDERYWKDYGWVFEWKNGNTVSFDEHGLVVDYWRYIDPITIVPPMIEDKNVEK